MRTYVKTSFSLIELLIALAVLAVVAAIIVPAFLNVQSQAVAVTLDANTQNMQNTYDQWQSTGGTITVSTSHPYGNSEGAYILFHLLTNADPNRAPAGNPISDGPGFLSAYDTAQSAAISLNVPMTDLTNNAALWVPLSQAIGHTVSTATYPSGIYCYFVYGNPLGSNCMVLYVDSGGNVKFVTLSAPSGGTINLSSVIN